MMDKQKGRYVFECDTCGETLSTTTGDFDLAQAQRKDEGWIATKDEKQGWIHLCPTCR